jgi:hypothetical protein
MTYMCFCASQPCNSPSIHIMKVKLKILMNTRELLRHGCSPLTITSRPTLGPTQPPLQSVLAPSSPGTKLLDRKLTTHLHKPRLSLRGAMPPLPIYLIVWWLVNHVGNFAFFFSTTCSLVDINTTRTCQATRMLPVMLPSNSVGFCGILFPVLYVVLNSY